MCEVRRRILHTHLHLQLHKAARGRNCRDTITWSGLGPLCLAGNLDTVIALSRPVPPCPAIVTPTLLAFSSTIESGLLSSSLNHMQQSCTSSSPLRRFASSPAWAGGTVAVGHWHPIFPPGINSGIRLGCRALNRPGSTQLHMLLNQPPHTTFHRQRLQGCMWLL